MIHEAKECLSRGANGIDLLGYWNYELEEQDHHFRKKGNKYYCVSKIYRNVT